MRPALGIVAVVVSLDLRTIKTCDSYTSYYKNLTPQSNPPPPQKKKKEKEKVLIIYSNMCLAYTNFSDFSSFETDGICKYHTLVQQLQIRNAILSPIILEY